MAQISTFRWDKVAINSTWNEDKEKHFKIIPQTKEGSQTSFYNKNESKENCQNFVHNKPCSIFCNLPIFLVFQQTPIIFSNCIFFFCVQQLLTFEAMWANLNYEIIIISYLFGSHTFHFDTFSTSRFLQLGFYIHSSILLS